MLRIINDPFRLLFTAVDELFPAINCDIQYNHELDIDKQEYGVTIFPDDENVKPLIEINPELKINDAIEILAHELAHVVSGSKEEHGSGWQMVFAKIHEKFNEVYKREAKYWEGQ